ncbi:MAG: hypothetical protein KBF21_04755 [Thermoanaerobaculia bacterium]|nr:hypothetical protein [Thermoanaerobaculia bacterium]MBP9823514.1 hypothetical protein [Thermoanaerobaculia bacterium]
MGWIEKGWEELSKRLRVALEPYRDGEELVGVVHANQLGLFSAQLFAIGVTPTRLILLPLDRRSAAAGEPVVLRAADIEASAIWGWGGSVGDWIQASSGQQLRFTAAGRKYKLMVLGGNLLEDALSGPSQRSGLQALLDFLLAARS